MSKAIHSELRKKYLSKEDIATIKGLKKAFSDNIPNITCMGLYNHGKSTLLNVLVEDFEHKTFQAADTRKTVKNKKVMHDSRYFVDTPGLNAQKHDDKRVMDAVRDSNINIFVHNVSIGEFNKAEVSFFHDVKKHWKDPKEFLERTIFVLTRIDEIDDDSQITRISEKMRQQIKEIFDVHIDLLPVSAQDYTIGMQENEEELVEISNIPVLKSEIDSLVSKVQDSAKEIKRKRLETHFDAVLKSLQSKLEETKLAHAQIENDRKRQDGNLKKDLKKVEKTLKRMYERIQ